MTTLNELLAKKKEIDSQISAIQLAERKDAIAEARAYIDLYSLTANELFRNVRISKKQKRPPKYRDPISGATWAGQGFTPKWLQGKNKADFAI